MDNPNPQNDHDLLIELRTEMKGLRGDIKDLKDNLSTRVSLLEDRKADKEEMDKEMENNKCAHDAFVTREEFDPVKKVVYGGITVILTAVLLALIYLVIPK